MVNDHFLKGAALLPPSVTGKISDFAGLVFFPLLCTAAIDLLLLAVARLGAPVDFSLRPYKLALAILATAALFSCVKLSGAGARTVADALSAIGFPSVIVADPTDLVALPALLLAGWVGLKEIARVPLGRLEVLERSWRRQHAPMAAGLRDVGRYRVLTRRAGAASAEARAAATAEIDALAAALERYLETGTPDAAAATEDALRWFREPTASRPRRP